MNVLLLIGLLFPGLISAHISDVRLRNKRNSYEFIKHKHGNSRRNGDKIRLQNDNLGVESPGLSALTTQQDFQCSLPPGQQVVSCEVINSSGQIWTVVENGGVLDSDGILVVGYESLASSTQCGVRILSLSSQDYGDWECRIGRSGGSTSIVKGFANIRQDSLVPNVRLPPDVAPSHYDLQIIPKIEPNRIINGHFSIDVAISSDVVSEIVLHIQDLSILEDTIQVVFSSIDLVIMYHGYDLERQFYKIGFVATGFTNYNIQVSGDYTASLDHNQMGFYYDSYIDSSDTLHELGVTQHEPTWARMSFPSFDEPAMKATFDVRLGHTPSQTALSNMPKTFSNIPIDEHPGYLWDVFNTSVLMSSYLVALAVSDFSSLPCATLDNNVEMTIWARPEAISQGLADWPQSYAPENLRYYEQLFQIPYPLPKMDMFVAPSRSGAMENWGLITYGEPFFLFDPVTGGPAEKELATSVVTHELVHQWFGNLVTMEWWNGLWLNEGFATFTSYYGAEHVSPEMTHWDRFTIDEMHGAMYLDSFPDSHPVNYNVTNPDEIDQAFDRISYDKGGSILMMLNAFLTEETFLKGVHRYLTQLAYSNAIQDDLWQQMNDAGLEDGTLDADKSIKTIMESWTEQKNYPLLTVERIDDSSIMLQQSRFVIKDDPEGPGNYGWWIPITYTAVADPSTDFEATATKLFMDPTESSLLISADVPMNLPVIFNLKQTTFLRVNYDDYNWQLIRDFLIADHTQIHMLNRAQILDDSFSIAEANIIPYPTALDNTRYLTNEMDYVPFFAVNVHFRELERHFRVTGSNYILYRNYLQSLLRYRMAYLDIDETEDFTFIENLSRLDILPISCMFDTPECQDPALERFNQWMGVQNPDDPAQNPYGLRMRKDLYCSSLKQNLNSGYDFLMQRYQNGIASSTERSDVVYGLACPRDAPLLQDLLTRTLNTNDPLNAEIVKVTELVTRNQVGITIIYQWIEDNWATLGIVSPRDTVMQGVAYAFSDYAQTQGDIDVLNQFLADHGSELSAETVASVQDSITKITENIEWASSHLASIVNWLQTLPTL